VCDYRSVFLTFIQVPDDGSAEPKHVVYWHNFRTIGIVYKQVHTGGVSDCVYCYCNFVPLLNLEYKIYWDKHLVYGHSAFFVAHRKTSLKTCNLCYLQISANEAKFALSRMKSRNALRGAAICMCAMNCLVWGTHCRLLLPSSGHISQLSSCCTLLGRKQLFDFRAFKTKRLITCIVFEDPVRTAQ
jgi:hypothetical protein